MLFPHVSSVCIWSRVKARKFTRHRANGRWLEKAVYSPFDSSQGEPITCSTKLCIFSCMQFCDVDGCRRLSLSLSFSNRFDGGGGEVAAIKGHGTKGRRHCESTYNEVMHAFTTRIFLPFKRSSGSGDGAFFSPLLRIIRWSLIETSLKIERVRISDFSESLCSFISSKIGAQVVTETNFLVDRTLVVF